MDHRHAFATLSFISETFLFLYVGMDALDIEKWKIVSQTYRHVLSLFLCLDCPSRSFFFFLNLYFFIMCSPVKSIALSSTILALVLVSRAAFVFPLSFLSNLTKKTPNGKISFRQQVSLKLTNILTSYALLKQLLCSLHDIGHSGYCLVGGSHERCCVHCVGLQ